MADAPLTPALWAQRELERAAADAGISLDDVYAARDKILAQFPDGPPKGAVVHLPAHIAAQVDAPEGVSIRSENRAQRRRARYGGRGPRA